MEKIVNNKVFEVNDSSLIPFYETHGWVVVKGIFSQKDISAFNQQWKEMLLKYSKEIGVSLEEYMADINQWRDLWLHGGVFRDAIFNEQGLQSSVKKAMNWKGIQLIYDHIISKPLINNDKIPWHQDSMFLPIDMPGCLSWTALQDVSINSGCLEVLDCSHKDGCYDPVDFIDDERTDIESNYQHLQLPVKSGETVLLHNLTWHRSSPNTKIENRVAHIAVWAHPTSKWLPDLVDWHPINEFVESNPKEYLRGERFPYFGEIESINKPKDWHSGTKTKENSISMFDVSDVIAQQLSKILDQSGDISSLLSSEQNRQKIIKKTIDAGIYQDQEKMSDMLQKIWLSQVSYKKHKSRNAFISSYKQWWNTVGLLWEKRLKENGE